VGRLPDNMDKKKPNIFLILSSIYMIITGAINIYGYFNLPEVIATQFSLTGRQVNTMKTPIYLLGSFAIVVILSVLCIKKEKEQQIKYLLISSFIVIVNIVMIITQLK
jgi:uncharacterized membrane protein